MLHAQTLCRFRSGLNFRLQADSQERRIGWQEKPTFTRASVNGEHSPHRVPQACEVIEERVLAKTISGEIQLGTGVEQENPVAKRSGGSLAALAYDCVFRCRRASKTNGNNRQNQSRNSHGRIT